MPKETQIKSIRFSLALEISRSKWNTLWNVSSRSGPRRVNIWGSLRNNDDLWGSINRKHKKSSTSRRDIHGELLFDRNYNWFFIDLEYIGLLRKTNNMIWANNESLKKQKRTIFYVGMVWQWGQVVNCNYESLKYEIYFICKIEKAIKSI